MSFYEEAIRTATGCSTEEAPRVEEIMRCQFSTLDHLPRDEFDAEARVSFEALLVLRADGDPHWMAESVC